MYSNIEAGAVVYHKSYPDLTMILTGKNPDNEQIADCKYWDESIGDFVNEQFYYYELVDTGITSEDAFRPYNIGDTVRYLAFPKLTMTIVQINGSQFIFDCRFFNPVIKKFEKKKFFGKEIQPAVKTTN